MLRKIKAKRRKSCSEHGHKTKSWTALRGVQFTPRNAESSIELQGTPHTVRHNKSSSFPSTRQLLRYPASLSCSFLHLACYTVSLQSLSCSKTSVAQQIRSKLLPSPPERTRCRYLPTARRHIPKHTYSSSSFLVALKHCTVPKTPRPPAKCRYGSYNSTISSQMQVQFLQLHSLPPNAGTVPTTTLSPAKCRYGSYNSTLSSQMQVQFLQLHSLRPNAGTVPTTPLSPAKCRYSSYNSTLSSQMQVQCLQLHSL